MAKDGTKGLTPQQWADVRKAFETGTSIAELSRTFGVKRETIAAHRDREAWVIGQAIGHLPGKAEQRAVRERIQSNVVDFTTRQAIEHVKASGMVEDTVNEIVVLRRLALKMATAYEKFADEVIAGTLGPSEIPATRDMSQFMKDTLGGYKLLLSTIREDIGRKAGEATEKTSSASKPTGLRFVAAPKPEELASEAS